MVPPLAVPLAQLVCAWHNILLFVYLFIVFVFLFVLWMPIYATVPPLATPLAQLVGARYFPSGATLGAW